MGVYNHWGGAGNGGAVEEWGVYCPLPEHGRTVHCDSSYHGIVSGIGVEDGTATIQAMVVSASYVYKGDKSGACSNGGGGGDGYGRLRGIWRWRVGKGRIKGGGRYY